jgi:hypothetical protein
VNHVRLNTIGGTRDNTSRDHIPLDMRSPTDFVYVDPALRDVPDLVPENLQVHRFIGGLSNAEDADA